MDALQIRHALDQIEIHATQLRDELLRGISDERVDELEDKVSELESELEDEKETHVDLTEQVGNYRKKVESTTFQLELLTAQLTDGNLMVKIQEIIDVLKS